MPISAEWKTSILPGILETFESINLFNADETALNFRGYPNRGLRLVGEPFSGGKRAMERITVMCCANMDGSENKPLIVIGKSKNPRCFPKNHTLLPVTYRSSANAWMTSSLFHEWLDAWNRQLQIEGRTICLLIDNCTAHTPNATLSHIVLQFLPHNTTSIMQPMDMGVIKNFKAHYRSRLNARIIACNSRYQLRSKST